MVKSENFLKAPETILESQLPLHIKPVIRPGAMGRAVELAFLRWEKRSLERTEKFLIDFGFQDVQRTKDRLVARGTGPSPAIFVATLGEKNRFLGLAFVMSEDTDLNSYVRTMGAEPIDKSLIPGGGIGVALTDPGGRSVWLLQGQVEAQELPNRASVTNLINSPDHQPRVNRAMRTPIESARIVRIGHIAVQAIDFNATMQWYMRVLGLIPTDVQYLEDGSPNLAFCRLNRGSTPSDHHTMVFAGGIEDKYEHSAYEVIDLDAVGQGQQILLARGYKHLWGIGRHFFGSQFFDYWYDPDGFEFEHYADGDLFTSEIETGYAPLNFDSVWAWGVDIPYAMKPPKNLHALITVIKRLLGGDMTLERLKLIGKVVRGAGRPWLK
jgi:Glyoxalase/Bleomycin resistance protein/Dioxygenase superfamily